MLARIATRIAEPSARGLAIAVFQVALMLLVIVDLVMVHEAFVGFRPHGAVWIAIQTIGFAASAMVPAEAWYRTGSADLSDRFVETWCRAADVAFAIWIPVFFALAVLGSSTEPAHAHFRSLF